MKIISIFKKVRAPSRIAFCEGLGCEAWRPRLLIGPQPAHLRSHEPDEQCDSHELEETPLHGHSPLGSTGHELIPEVADHESDERRNGSRKQVFHRLFSLNVLFSTPQLGQRLAVFQISDNINNVAYMSFKVKLMSGSPYGVKI